MPGPHISRSYDEELGRLSHLIMEMGGMVERQIAEAVQALSRRDGELADRVVAGDRRIDDRETEAVNLVLRLLALRQPLATDLRAIVVALKIAGDLERMGDYAKNIAKRARPLSAGFVVEPARAVPRAARLVEVMLHDVLDAYVQGDAAKAIRARAADAEVDALYSSLFRDLLTCMIEDSRSITACTHLLFVAKNIERMGDHVTNIAESVHFLVTGERLTEEREQPDVTGATVVRADSGTGGTGS